MGSHEEEICLVLTRLAMAGDGIVLGLGIAAIAVRTWIKFRSHSKALRQVDETPQVSVHDLRSLLEKDPSSSSSCRNPSPVLVIVRGVVSTTEAGGENVLTARNAGELAVFIERTQTYLYNEWRGILGWGSDWRGLLGWGSLKEQVSISRRKVPFVLLDNQQSKSKGGDYVHINMESVQHPLPLVTVYHKLHPVQTSSSTFLQAVFGRRYPVGVIDEEKILPLGREVTAVGVLSESADGHPVIKCSDCMPCFLTDCNREQLIVEIATGTNVLFWTGVILSSLAVGVLSYAVFKNWCKWKEWRRLKRRLDEASRRELQFPEEPAEDNADVPDGELCVVCLLRRRRAAFVSCGHRVCCMTCAQRVEVSNSAACPVCRQLVVGVIRIYD